MEEETIYYIKIIRLLMTLIMLILILLILPLNRFSNIKNAGKKIFILGDMLELGDIEIEEHNKLAKSFNMSDIDVILTYGKISENLHKYISKKKYSKHYYNKKNLKKLN